MMHDPLAAPMLDAAGLDLDSASRITYRLEQSFRYEYDAPVERLRHRLVVVPPRRHGDVHRRQHSLEVRGEPARRVERHGAEGNTVVHIQAGRVERRIEFHLLAVLERVVGDGAPAMPAAALDTPRLRMPAALTRPDDRLRDMAAALARPRENPTDTAERVCAAVHEAMTYRGEATSVKTTAAQALEGGAGVCQDFAHIMLSLCHLLGVPARYVSGHLLGQGGTHAWVEVVVPHAPRPRRWRSTRATDDVPAAGTSRSPPDGTTRTSRRPPAPTSGRVPVASRAPGLSV